MTAAGIAEAHPGHDGHDLTWDFSHLAQHPVATMSCAMVVGAGVAVLVHALGLRKTRSQSLRVSERNRGK
ncbi:MAG TPA: hypothetical protein VGE76_10475 [Opitutaceae bacterium]